ncbi:hypothetical protein G6F32_014430 [Rhizopus arrhizus]|nr:hypothetical protein G6F32_014430 [Rhizopus arrhizus]
MFIETLHDSLNNVGNRVVTHQADGSFTESSKPCYDPPFPQRTNDERRMRRGPDGVFLFRTACPDVRRRRLAQARNNRVTAQRRSARRVARESAVSPAFMAGRSKGN